jgi:cyclic di-GMP phosphodiesterase
MNVLIIDDEQSIRQNLSDYLEDSDIDTRTASNGLEGFNAVIEESPDVIIVDLNMPVMDGWTFIKEVTKRFDDLPIIVLSGVGLVAEAMKAVKAGAWDFLSKPIADMQMVIHVIEKCMEKVRLIRENKHYQTHLEELVQMRTKQIEITKRQIIHCLGKASEFKDNETGNHVIRVGEISFLIARELGFDEDFCRLIRQAAPMHDVGKIGISDSVLLKNGPLNDEEWKHMQSHVTFGCEILSPLDFEGKSKPCSPEVLLKNATPSDILDAAKRVALFHHERWDGKGYLHGLKGEQIPIEARIVSIADVYDAVSSKRPYKEAYPETKCQAIIREGKGSQFDPEIVDVFLNSIRAIVDIKHKFAD